MRRTLIPAAAILALAAAPAFAAQYGSSSSPATTPAAPAAEPMPSGAPAAQPATETTKPMAKPSTATVQYNTVANIKMAQQKLKDLGKYAGPVDGRANAQFRTALIAFQKDHKLEATGRLNAKTLKALKG